MFPTGSQRSPQLFPIAPQIYPIWFAQSSTFKVYKLKRWACLIGECAYFYFAIGVQRGASIWEMPNVPKNLMIGQSIWLLQPKQKRKRRKKL
jgi:hypothetical protein